MIFYLFNLFNSISARIYIKLLGIFILDPFDSRHADNDNVLTSRDYLVIYGDYPQTLHSMG